MLGVVSNDITERAMRVQVVLRAGTMRSAPINLVTQEVVCVCRGMGKAK